MKLCNCAVIDWLGDDNDIDQAIANASHYFFPICRQIPSVNIKSTDTCYSMLCLLQQWADQCYSTSGTDVTCKQSDNAVPVH